MAFSEFEQKRYGKAVEVYLDSRRPPVEMRKKLDLGYRIEGQAIEIFTVRPKWNAPSEKMESPIAKVKFNKSQGGWKVYWMKSDLKWHIYEPVSEVTCLEAFFDVLNADVYGSFWG